MQLSTSTNPARIAERESTPPTLMDRPLSARLLQALTAALLLTLGAGSAQATEAVSGAALAAAKGCVACHGTDGVATAPSYPNLTGQWERYLRLQLMAYRSGKRQNELMNVFAKELTDDEIRELARHYGDG